MQAATFFVFAVLAISAQARVTDDQKALIKQQFDHCVEKTGVDKALIAKARKNDFTEDEKLVDYMDCMATKLGLKNDDGTMNADAIVAILPSRISKEDGTKVLTKCVKHEPAVPAKKVAYATYKCAAEGFQTEVNIL